MRPVYPALLALAPLTVAQSPFSEKTALCIRAHTRNIWNIVPCVESMQADSCLHAHSYNGLTREEAESCIAASGCSDEDAAGAVAMMVGFCESGGVVKRQRGGSSADEDEDADDEEDEPSDKKPTRPAPPAEKEEKEEEVEDEKPGKNQPEVPAPAEPSAEPPKDDKPTPAPAPASPAPAQTEEPAPAAPNPDVTTPAVPAKGRVTAVAQTDKGPTGTDCYTTLTEVKNVCTINADGRHECEDRDILKPRCRDGYLCRMGRQGDTACMEKIDKLDVGGVIVSIAFASAIVIAIALMTFFCCRDKKRQKTLAAKLEAAAIAKASSVGKKPKNVSDRQPLMTQAPPGSPGNAGPPPSTYGADPQQPNPFTDQSRY